MPKTPLTPKNTFPNVPEPEGLGASPDAPLEVRRRHGCQPSLRVRSWESAQSPSNRSRKRFSFPAPLGSGPFRGPLFFLGPVVARRSAGVSFTDMSTSTPPTPPGAERILAWIMGALVVWGLFHAAGAWTLNHDARRPLIVLACVAAFLGFWLALLAARRRRLAHRQIGTREQQR